jgi:predicted RNA binding protein YcfA (HicA-like mRNA interferase family)
MGLPAVTSLSELSRKFKSLGWQEKQGRKHWFFVKGTQKVRKPNPHGKREIHVSLLAEILRQARIDDDTWNAA